MEREGKLKTVEKALALMLLFSHDRAEWGVTELARELRMHKSIVSRLLATLEARGFVARDEQSRRYRLGLRLLELGNVVSSQLEVRRICLPAMKELTALTQEASFLNILADGESVCIEKVESPQNVRIVYQVGWHTMLHAGAPAKLFLATLPDDQVERIMRHVGLPRFTETTITDPVELWKELANIRLHGYSYSYGELTPSVATLSAPVRDYTGGVAAALSIAGPIERFGDARMPDLIRALLAAAERASNLLAGKGAPVTHIDVPLHPRVNRPAQSNTVAARKGGD